MKASPLALPSLKTWRSPCLSCVCGAIYVSKLMCIVNPCFRLTHHRNFHRANSQTQMEDRRHSSIVSILATISTLPMTSYPEVLGTVCSSSFIWLQVLWRAQLNLARAKLHIFNQIALQIMIFWLQVHLVVVWRYWPGFSVFRSLVW